MVPVPTLTLVKGQGITGDRNADPLSPRQVLITRKEDLDDLEIPYGGLRENMIVEGLREEDFVPGALMIINDQAHIRLTFYCEPCKRIANVVPNLKAVVRRRGILGSVLSSGPITVSDLVASRPKAFAALSDIPYKRFIDFIKSVPPGYVVTYKMVARGIGVAESFIRAMPRYIEKAMSEDPSCPVHRIVDETGTLLRYIPNQAQLLARDKITTLPGTLCVDLENHLWTGHPPAI